MILILNGLLYIMDIYLFATASAPQTPPVPDPKTGINLFSTFLGAILCSSDLIYLILLPMLIAKNHSEKMSQLKKLSMNKSSGPNSQSKLAFGKSAELSEA